MLDRYHRFFSLAELKKLGLLRSVSIPSANKNYRAEPTASFDPSRLSFTDKIFRTNSNVEEKLYSKHIIVSAISLRSMNNYAEQPEIFQIIKKLVHCLLTLNFSINLLNEEGFYIQVKTIDAFLNACNLLKVENALSFEEMMQFNSQCEREDIDWWDETRIRELAAAIQESLPIYTQDNPVDTAYFSKKMHGRTWINFNDYKQMDEVSFDVVLKSIREKEMEGIVAGDDYPLRDTFIKKWMQVFPHIKHMALEINYNDVRINQSVKRLYALRSDWNITNVACQVDNDYDFYHLINWSKVESASLDFRSVPANFFTAVKLMSSLRNLTISGALTPTETEKFTAILASPVTNLEININSKIMQNFAIQLLTRFAKTIESLSIYCVDPDLPAQTIDIPFPNLKKLCFLGKHNNCFYLLPSLLRPSLTFLQIEGEPDCDEMPDKFEEKIYLPNLKLSFIGVNHFFKKIEPYLDKSVNLRDADPNLCRDKKGYIIFPHMRMDCLRKVRRVYFTSDNLDEKYCLRTKFHKLVDPNFILEINFENTLKDFHFLNFLTFLELFPNLETLRLELGQNEILYWEMELFPSLETYTSGVKYFSLWGGEISSNVLVWIISLFPHLEVLELHHVKIKDTSKPCWAVLPKVHRLVLDNVVFEMKTDKYVNLMRELIPNENALRSLLIHSANGFCIPQFLNPEFLSNLSKHFKVCLHELNPPKQLESKYEEIEIKRVTPHTKDSTNFLFQSDGFSNLRKYFPNAELPHSVYFDNKVDLKAPQKNIKSKTKNITHQTELKKDEKTVLSTVKYFHPKHSHQAQVKFYRLSVPKLKITTQDLSISEEIPTDLKPVDLSKIKKLNVAEFNHAIQKYQDSPTLYCVTLPEDEVSSEWCRLPTYTADDQLTELVTDDGVEIAHSASQKCYYGRRTDSQTIPIHYVLRATHLVRDWHLKDTLLMKHPKKDSIFNHIKLVLDAKGEISPIVDEGYKLIFSYVKKMPLEKRIAELLAYGNAFEPGVTDEKLQGIDRLNHFLRNRFGKCDQRTFVCAVLATLIGVEAYYIDGLVHAFLEIVFQGKRYRADLDGYPATVEEKLVPKPEARAIYSLKDLSPFEKSKKADDKKSVKTETKTETKTDVKYSPLVPDFEDYLNNVFEDIKLFEAYEHQGLLLLNSSQQILNFHITLLDHTLRNKQHYIYIDDLSEVKFKLLKVNRPDGSCQFVPSFLVDQLKQAKAGTIFAINFSKFKPEDTGYNALFDDQRIFDEIEIPPGVIILGLLEKDRSHHFQEDFYSRFRVIEENFPRSIPLLTPKKACNVPRGKNIKPLELFGGEHWEKDILGMPSLKGNKLTLLLGELVKILEDLENLSSSGEKYDGIEFLNPPINCREFDIFFSEIIQKRKFNFQGKEYKLPDNFWIGLKTQAYSFEGSYSITPFAKVTDDWEFVLNKQTLNDFLSGSKSESGFLNEAPGLIKQHAEKSLRILLTGELSENEWARLIAAANSAKCYLHIAAPQDLSFPAVITKKKISLNQDKKRDEKYSKTVDLKKVSAINKPTLIYTNDIHFTAKKYKHLAQHMIAVNETTEFSDLWQSLSKPKLDEKNATIHLQSEFSDVWNWLVKGESVLLRGKFSKELIARMETLFAATPYLWINGKKEELKGELIIVTDSACPFIAAQAYAQEKVTKEDWEKSADEKTRALCNSLMPPTNYSQFESRLREAKNLPYRTPGRSQALLSENPLKSLADLKKPARAAPEMKAKDDAVERRINKIALMLSYSPYVFVVGPSGSGKSTIIRTNIFNHYKKLNPKAAMFEGLGKLEDWASRNQSTDPTILFIDEANLEAPGLFDIFEGLFNDPPGILIRGKYYEIKPNQKIIFAGNYFSYAGRMQHDFFRNHEFVMSFRDWPEKTLREAFVLPLLKKLLPTLESKAILHLTDYFIFVYQWMKKNNPTILFTPRNLHALCLRAAIFYQEKTAVNLLPKLVIMQCLQDKLPADQFKKLEVDLISKDSKEVTTEACGKVLKARELTLAKEFKSTSYQLLPSRYPVLQELENTIAIRKLRSECKDDYLTKIGPRGLILEGISGVGKTELAEAFLQSKSFIKATLQNKDHESIIAAEKLGKVYFKITPRLSENLESILLEGFNRGWVFLIDEFNTNIPETLLNDLMSGEYKGQKPLQEGFCVIATANPPSQYVGRKKRPASENRLDKKIVPDYSQQELISLAVAKGLSQDQAENVVVNYLDRKSRSRIPLTTRYFYSLVKAEKKKAQVLPKTATLAPLLPSPASH